MSQDSDAKARKVSGKKRKITEIFRKLSQASERLETLEIKYIFYLHKFYESVDHNFDYRSYYVFLSSRTHSDAVLRLPVAK